jgi:predicted ATPase
MNFYTFFKEHAEQHNFQQNLRQEDLVQYLDKIFSKLQRSFWKNLCKPALALKGIYIYGSVGAGKTYIMDLFFQFFKGTKKRAHFKLFMLDLHKNGYKETIESYKHIKLLCLDELEIIDISDAMIVKKIFDELARYGVFILTTSNASPQELYKNGLHYDRFEPFIAYLTQHFHIFDLILETDYRQYAPSEIRATDHNLHTQILNTVLIDQTLRLESYSDSICIDFKDLINYKFGPQHFYDLSKKCPIIYLKDIPFFDETNTNLLRQFITLVDIYYDQNNKLRIYDKKQLSFCDSINLPIKRLRSRIFEMA